MVSLKAILLASSLAVAVAGAPGNEKPAPTTLSTATAKPTDDASDEAKHRPKVCGVPGYVSQGGVDGSQYEMPWVAGDSEAQCRKVCRRDKKCRLIAFAPPWCFPYSANSVKAGFGENQGSTYIWWEKGCPGHP